MGNFHDLFGEPKLKLSELLLEFGAKCSDLCAQEVYGSLKRAVLKIYS
jgi:hypothetical protein